MTEPRRDDPLVLDVRRDVARVDGVMSRILADSAASQEFIRAPNVVLARYGLHPETSPEIHDRVNSIFYAVLTNTELLNLVAENLSGYDARADENEPILQAALRRGEIENSVELDMAAVEHILSSPDFMRRSFTVTLNDLSDRGLLVGTYSREQISDYVERLVQAIVERRPVAEHPVLEAWDDNYGVGKEFGVGFFEVAPPITVAVPVEAFAELTVYNHIYSYTHQVIDRATTQALRGDPEAARHLVTTGAMIRFAGEVIAHAQTLDQL
ncbi:hypothetical protein [Nonomuraea sp. LPB2021202275-12-8]|uniref:hypothetical protein n=1 Tax=Nonomuraea sp. LPB2021202275-12-8 TaxID=3120159 RepID=UPI00300D17F5